MFCYYCGKEIDDDSVFCPFCGEKVNVPEEPEVAEEPEVTEEPEETTVVPPQPPETNNNKKIIIIVAIIVAALVAAALIFFLGRGGDKEEPPTTTQATEATEPTEATSDVEIPEATEFNGNYYEVINVGSDWYEAKLDCEEMGGHLAIITSQEEEDFIEGLIESNRSDDIYHYWLGASDADEEGTWMWLDGQIFWEGGPAAQGGHSVDGMYNNWLPSQPNNSVKELETGQDFLEIQVTQGNEGPAEYMTWTDILETGIAYGYEGPDDYNDTQYYGYICEWEGDDL